MQHGQTSPFAVILIACFEMCIHTTTQESCVEFINCCGIHVILFLPSLSKGVLFDQLNKLFIAGSTLYHSVRSMNLAIEAIVFGMSVQMLNLRLEYFM